MLCLGHFDPSVKFLKKLARNIKSLRNPGLRLLVNRYFVYPVTRVWPRFNIKTK